MTDRKRKILRFIAIFAFLGSCWFIYQYSSITYIGEKSEPRQADVIIILGAGVWPEGPSPALLGRTAHGAKLYEQGLAQNMILSGGLGDYPPSEAEAMQEILLDLGIDRERLYLEREARNTAENIKFSKEIMEENGWQSAIIVSDTFHLKRALLLAQKYDLQASGSGAKNSILYMNKRLKVKYTVREVLAISRFHLMGWTE